MKAFRSGAVIAGVFAVAACAINATPLQQAELRYPPLIMGANVYPTDGAGPYPRSCPAAGSRVEQKGGPTMEYLGASPTDPDLCTMNVGGPMQAWYGIWDPDWPGAAQARPALARIIHGHTGEVAGFDTVVKPGIEWHDLIRNEGIEDIKLLGRTYQALKISHYREGFGGNIYRSVSTVWKDIPSGLLIYGTYQHISGKPELDDPLIPTAILPAR